MISSFHSWYKSFRFSKSLVPALYMFVAFSIIAFNSCSQGNNKPGGNNGNDSITLLHLPVSTPLPSDEKNKLHNECQQWFDTILKNSGFNGGVLVAKGGDIIFEKYKGAVKLGGADSITPETPFHIASVSKTITGMATLKLWQEGKISLDDEYSKYFPTFNYPGVTIRTLLNHRSGLPNYLSFMEKLWTNKKVHVRNQDIFDYLVDRKSQMENIARPDTRFSYCNTNYALLALLIEKVAGLPYPQYIHDNIFAPLQMSSSFVYSPEDTLHVAPPNYDWRGREIPMMFLDDVYGDKNVYSTVRDLLKWDRALSSNVMFTGATLAEAYKPYSHEKEGVKNYGLGWRMDNFPNGKKLVFHNGWWHGNNAAFLRLIDEDATIIAVSNRYASSTYKTKLLINDFAHYYDKGVEEETENTNAPPAPVVKEKTKAAPKVKTAPAGKVPSPAKKSKKIRNKK